MGSAQRIPFSEERLMSNNPCMILAHRGAHGGAPENTLRAIRGSLAAGAQALEIDVQAVADTLLVFHDRRLERRTDGNGLLAEHSPEVLRRLDAGGGERIPLLEEVLALVKGEALLNVELKGPRTAAPVARMLLECLSTGPWRREQLLVSSFNHRELRLFAELAPAIPLALLCEGVLNDVVATARSLGAGAVNLSVDFADPALIAEIQRAGLLVNVYTVNHPEDMRLLLRAGVNGLVTDELELAQRECLQQGREIWSMPGKAGPAL